jgi:GcrA cell cycle regulator
MRFSSFVNGMATSADLEAGRGGRPSGGRLVTLLELDQAHWCHWPIGDPAKPEFRFCERPVEPAEPRSSPSGNIRRCGDGVVGGVAAIENRIGRHPYEYSIESVRKTLS